MVEQESQEQYERRVAQWEAEEYAREQLLREV